MLPYTGSHALPHNEEALLMHVKAMEKRWKSDVKALERLFN